jgi:hypothetical protein
MIGTDMERSISAPTVPGRKASIKINQQLMSPPPSPLSWNKQLSSSAVQQPPILGRTTSLKGVSSEIKRRNSPFGISPSPMSLPRSMTPSISPSESPSQVSPNPPKFKLKYSYNDEKYCTLFEQDATVDEVYEKIRNKLSLDAILIKFEDEDVYYALNDNDDLEIAKESGKIFVTQNDEVSPSSLISFLFDEY